MLLKRDVMTTGRSINLRRCTSRDLRESLSVGDREGRRMAIWRQGNARLETRVVARRRVSSGETLRDQTVALFHFRKRKSSAHHIHRRSERSSNSSQIRRQHTRRGDWQICSCQDHKPDKHMHPLLTASIQAVVKQKRLVQTV